MTAQERVDYFLDEGSFESMDDHLQTSNPLNFPAYVEKIAKRPRENRLE